VGVTTDRLIEDLRCLGVEKGDLLHVKASLKSIGFVDGGAEAVVKALVEAVGEEGTVVADSFVRLFPLPLRPEHRAVVSRPDTPSYAGAVANAMVRHPRAHRSRHPAQKFAAVGARAHELMEAHTPGSEPYGVLRVMAEAGAKNLKIGDDGKVVGVGTTHVAICMLGFEQKRRPAGILYEADDGTLRLFERSWPGSCGRGFNNFIPLYRDRGAILSEGKVGEAPSKLTDMGRTLDIELEVLAEDPGFFLCSDPGCAACRLSWPFSDGWAPRVNWHRALKRIRRLV
jgi:aminoglycoside 3-N-acetyltransferase